MENQVQNDGYFDILDRLIKENGITIDRPKGSAHPRYPDRIYPIDYGFINGTKSQDGQGIDVFVGDEKTEQIFGIVCTIDKIKMDSEIKVLYNCNKKNVEAAMMMLTHDPMRTILITK